MYLLTFLFHSMQCHYGDAGDAVYMFFFSRLSFSVVKISEHVATFDFPAQTNHFGFISQKARVASF